MVTVVQHGFGDEDEDDAGHEGLQDFEQSRSGGHVADDLARPSLGEADLAHVGDGGQAGENGAHDAEVADLALVSGTPQEVDGKDDGGRQAEQGGVACKGDGKVLPGNRGSGLQAEKLHQDDEKSPGEAEGPAEDAKVSSAAVDSGPMQTHREGHTGEDQRSKPRPEQRTGLQDDRHGEIYPKVFFLKQIFTASLQQDGKL